jgi:hypothetical protein
MEREAMNVTHRTVGRPVGQRTRLHLRVILPAFMVVFIWGAGVQAFAQGNFGFGLIIGEPTGIAWKYKINYLNAIDGAIGFSPYDRFRIHADYLWQARPFQDEHLALHYGIGAAVGFGNTTYYDEHDHAYFLRHEELGFGARVVVGLTYAIPRSPVDLFFEMAPLIVATPEPGFGIDLGLGARVYP